MTFRDLAVLMNYDCDALLMFLFLIWLRTVRLVNSSTSDAKQKLFMTLLFNYCYSSHGVLNEFWFVLVLVPTTTTATSKIPWTSKLLGPESKALNTPVAVASRYLRLPFLNL